ncbi:MAG: hypothetical protein K6F09_09725 [Clostridiales bacterium]|nr:hypothetical protein [Clostridiales bacterium]
MKRVIGLMLVVSILLSVVTFAVGAKGKSDVTPVIFLSGYSSSSLFTDFGTEDQKQVWLFSKDDALAEVKKNIPQIVFALFRSFTGRPEAFGEQFADAVQELLPALFNNPDGTSVYDVQPWPNEPKLSTYNYLKSAKEDEIDEVALSAYVADKIGGDNTFVFHYDFRFGGYDNAELLKKYADKVLAFTGSDKVSFFGHSYGGFVIATYLSMFGDENKTKNVVLDVPALGGTSFARRFFEGDVDLSMYELVTLGETLLGSETNFAGFFDPDSGMGPINQTASAFLTSVRAMPIYYGSLWDLLTPDDYTAMKEKYLDPVENAEIIKESDLTHYKFMKNYHETFTKLQKNGTDISIICNYGSHSAFGGEKINDMLLDAERTSGAICKDFGERFEDGYKCAYTVCKNKSHNHLSPSMEIDASAAYLPEDTWFIKGQCHGCYPNDPYSLSLIEKLLFANEKTDIYTYPEYPQFNTSRCPHYGVYAEFDSSKPGYLGEKDKALVITNISSKKVTVTDVSFDGADISFKLPKKAVVLEPGKSVTVEFTGDVPKATAKHATVTVNFFKFTWGKMFSSRTFDIQINRK